MLKNHLKLSFRNLWKNKMLSALNLLGLSIGIGSVLTLIFSVYAYYTADAAVEDIDNIYYVKTVTTAGDTFNSTAFGLLDEITSTSPEVIAGTHLHGWGNIWLEHGESELQELTDYADKEFFEVFSLPLKYGDTETALQEKYSIILTDKVSKKMFGAKNPVGERIIADDSLNLTITGVLAPISPYSTFRIGVVLSNELLKDNPGFVANSGWDNSFTPSYLRVRPGTDIAQLEKHIFQLVQKNYPNPEKFASIKAMHFSDARMDSIPVVKTIINGSIAAAFFVLLIVLVNLLNLNASTMFRRTKDIAVRKILGGSKKSVVVQFCMENGILVFLSILISGFLFLAILLPQLNTIYGADFGEISFTLANDYPIVLYAIALGILVTLVVGVLPTLRFISIPVSKGIKGKLDAAKSNFIFRNAFVILQFSIAILFICVAIILNKQIGYMKSAPLGFEKENVLVGNIDLTYKNKESAGSNMETLLNKLNANPFVKSTSTSQAVPSEYARQYTDFYEASTEKFVKFRRSYTDDGYLKTLEIPVVEGRDFSENLDEGDANSVIINKTALKALGWNSIQGKRLKFKNDESAGLPVVGVMDDFHYQDMQNAVEPLVHFYRNKKDLETHRFLSVRIVPGHEKEIQNMIASEFKGMETRRNYESKLLSDKVSLQYSLIEGMLKTVNVVALLTIFISCLGMFGLISFMAKRRIKEIGIRKVLGAGVLKIVLLLSKDYILLVGIAALIAFPLSWFLMNAWLGSFAYSITIQWWMFALGGLITLLITTFTLSIQAIKSATVNPVKSLRSE